MASVRALVLTADDGTAPRATLTEVERASLPPLGLHVQVAYSTLNYKDGMVLKGLGKLVRTYPHVPGVDLVGRVIEDASGRFAPGSWVIVTGYRMGELTWGGFADEARVDPSWAVPLPDGLSPREAMAIGTAGLTAMLALLRLEEAGLPHDRGLPLLVTGASGGVGSIAVTLAHARGVRVVASTGRLRERAYLERLGADEVIDRAELQSPSSRPLEHERFCGAIDSVGGTTLARILAQTAHGGAIASVGNAGGIEFTATVLPLLLRGVSILGIDSVYAPFELRERAWQLLAAELDRELLAEMTEEIPLDEVEARAEAILAGRVRGRTVVRLQGD
jgi:acrylyl-CoA reductase (NADPH)